MSYDNLSSASQNILKFYQQLTDEEGRIPFIFNDFHCCHSRVIGLDVTENRIFTLCHMITWVVFLRMFWNFISSLPVKRGWSLSFLVRTISNILVMEIGWTDVGSGGYILVSCAHSNTSLFLIKKKAGCCGHDRMVVGFTTTYTISAYHHYRCELESRSWQGVPYATLCDKVC